MADDNETEFEEEFDFESEEDLLESAEEEFGEGTPDYGGGGGSNLPPLPVLIGGAAVGIIIIIIIVVMMSGGDDEKIAPPPPAPEPIVEELPTQQPAPIVEEDPWASSSDTFGDDKPAITPKTVVERIEAQEQAINTQIRALEMKMNELLSKLSRLDQAVGASSRDIEDISLKLEAINQELKMMAAPAPAPTEKDTVEEVSEAYSNPTLTVHAIIPGRAWLKTRDGRTITVTEGDPVEGYGKVLAIDAPSGVVMTSSGVILR